MNSLNITHANTINAQRLATARRRWRKS